MIAALLSVIAIFLLLVLVEFLWRKKIFHTELSRKLVHITVGVFVAFWPYFISWGYIEILSLAFIVVVILTTNFHIFRSIHSVNRSTVGEVLFAIAVALLAIFIHTKWIFTAAMLHLSLADGLAAVTGLHYGRAFRYYVFSHPKSYIGSLTFFVTSFLIVLFTVVLGNHTSWSILIWLPLVATLTESVGVFGVDNFIVPLVVVAALELIK